MKFARHPANPVLKPNVLNDWEALNVFNPSVVVLNGLFHMHYRAQGVDYVSKIGYAVSVDGVNWTRYADQPVLPLTPGGFDSTSQTYPSVVDMGEEIWMFYTGDGLGATGIGLATLDKDELR